MFTAISHAFTQLLFSLASLFNGNLGLAILALTLLVRSVLVPITLPAIKSQKKIQDLQPQLNKLKKKHGHDKKLLQQKQLELYQQAGINPAAGCLPQIVQLILLIILYRVFISSLNQPPANIVTHFLWLNLSQPDNLYVLPTLAAILQFLLGVMLSPGASTKAEHQLAAQTPSKKDDQQADDMTQMASSMQSQMIFMMPVITFFFALRFPSGLALYWVATTLFSLIQQYFVSGLGGLRPHLAKLGLSSPNQRL